MDRSAGVLGVNVSAGYDADDCLTMQCVFILRLVRRSR